jgi:hypothetical protein
VTAISTVADLITLLREQDQDGQPFVYFNEADVESYCEITGVQLVPHQFTVDDCVIMVGRCASVDSPLPANHGNDPP